MNWPTSASKHEATEDVAPGVSRVRPAQFRSLQATTQGPSALRAYRPSVSTDTAPSAPLSELGVPRPAPSARRSFLTNAKRDAAPAPRATVAKPATSTDLEQHLAPLRGISRELVARGMPSTLVAELLSEIVVEYGNQVLVSERDARLALVEQLLLRIPNTPFDEQLTGSLLVTGPAGAGKSVFIAHLALTAARQGRRDVVLVNTAGDRIGAAAQMNALGQVFGYTVEHIYRPQDLRALRSRLGPGPLLLVETAGWSPRDGDETGPQPWRWLLPDATLAVCVPATGQADDLQHILSTTREAASDAVAALCKTSETRNVLPALGALALRRQPLGMIVPGANLAAETAPLDLAEVARTALGVVIPQRKKGRVR